MNNYSEQIFQSIDTIISQRLNEVKFDRTITCEVVAGVEDYPNKYWVSDGATKFQACVANSSRTYMAGQKVYVLIPNGDYNNADKVIIGSYTADELPKNLYTNPFDHLVYSSKLSFVADKYIETSINTESPISIGEQEIAFNYSNTTPFDYIGLDFSFDTTDLQGMQKGNYGIQFILKNNDEEIFTSAIDSSQLYGDIYNFYPLIKMQHLFPIPTEVDITQANKLEVNLYQKGNFDIAKKKIYLKSATFYFGYDVEKIDSNKLILHLDKSESLTFKEGEDLTRNLYLEWQDTDLNKIYNSEEKPEYEYTIYWCKYIPGYAKTAVNDIEESGVYWKTIHIGDFNYIPELDANFNTQQYKVGVKYKQDDEDRYLESNALIFSNTGGVKPEPGSTNNSEDSIKLTCSDSGVYNYYTYTGDIVDTSYLNQERIITATFLDGYNFPEPDSKSNNIKWIIPTENTMISKIATGISDDKKSAYLKYKITNNYWPGIKENNTIICEVTFPTGEVRRGRIALQFGGESVVGSEYFFNIYFADNKYSLQYNKKDSLKVKIAFGRRDGEKISIKPTINWEILNPAGITLSTVTGEETILNREATSTITNNLAILKASTDDENYQLGNGLTAKFEAYLPIPLSSEGHHISGPTKIVYDTTNSNLKRYSNKPYVLYDKDNKEIANVSWEIYYDKGTPEKPNPYPIDYPVLKKGKLYPIANALDDMPVVCVNAIKNNVVIWSQPIYSSKYRWEFGLLNNWSGNLTIDKEQNAVMAATLVAGKKAIDDNSFTGVAMGEIVNSSTKKPLESGLYGFEKGVSRFYLNNAGAFFVGDGDNYISFNDANKGTRDKDGNATFAVNVNKLLLNTPQIKIISSEPKNSISDTEALRVKLGWIKDDVYGLDIYNGAFRMYGVPWKEGLTDEDANIYFLQNNDTGKIDMAINGAFNRLVPIQWSLPEGTTRPYQTEINGTLITIIDSYGTNFNDIVPNTTFFSGLSAGLYGQIKYQFLSTSPLFTINIPDNKKQQFILGTTFRAISTAKENLLRNVLCSNGINLEIFCKPDSSILTDNPNIEIYTNTGSNIKMSKNILNITCNNYHETARYDYQTGVQLNSNIITISVYTSAIQMYPQILLSADASNGSSQIQISAKNIYTDGTWSGSVSGGTTSDSRYKNSITDLSSAYSVLFDNLTPKKFKYNDGTSNRFHTGFIAQDVNEAVKNSGLTTQDFAATILLNKDKENEQWALRYEEFIALNTWQIQKLKQRVTELENEIKEIKQNENN